MYKAIFITKTEIFTKEFESLDGVANEASATKGLLFHKCTGTAAKKREKKSKESNENFR